MDQDKRLYTCRRSRCGSACGPTAPISAGGRNSAWLSISRKTRRYTTSWRERASAAWKTGPTSRSVRNARPAFLAGGCRRLQAGSQPCKINRANSDLTRSIGRIRPTNEQYNLFLKYINGRHRDGQMANMGRDDFISMIENSPIESCVVSYRDEDGRLVGCVLTDVQDDGLSAVYSFFDPADSARSLGTYMILDLLRYTAERTCHGSIWAISSPAARR